MKKKIHAAVSLIARERAYWGEWAWRDKLKTVNQCQSFKKFNNIVKMLSMQEDKPYGRDRLFHSPHMLETRNGRGAPG
ncbi:hypothetical protein, partial [Limnohabitans sp.]|uniref:hypothetical protein n=1 Tax=Limnohabitans sp. TaxID=1907725 RepID=UPI00289DAC1D